MAAASHRSSISAAAETWVLVATIMASSMSFISTTALNLILPALQDDLKVGGAQVLWIVNANALLLSALILVGGSLGDHYGRKRIFTLGIVVFSAASVVCGLAPTVGLLIAARAAQGVGGALMVPGSLAILSASFPPERRGRAIGTWSTFSTMTTAFGPILGGWLASQGLWRWVFFINVPLALVALYALLRVPESRDETASRQLDYTGALLVTLGLAGITYGFIQAPDFGFGDIRIAAALAGGAAALAAFIRVQARSDHPMMPLRLFRSRTFSGANALTFFLYAALSGSLFFLPLNLIQVQGYPAEMAALALLPFTLLLTALSRWAGGLIDRVGARLPLIIGPTITGAGFAALAVPGLTGSAGDYWLTYFPGVVLLGVGMGITVAPLTTAVMISAPSSSTGIASGINNTVARSAGVLAVAVLGAVGLLVFGALLRTNTPGLNLPDAVRVDIEAEASKLGDARVPPSLTAHIIQGSQNGLKWGLADQTIRLAFVDTFRLITLAGAGLSWLSALMAWLLVESRPHEPASPENT